MPLVHSGSQSAFRDNVAEMVRAGHPRAQALAASFRNQRQFRDMGGGIGGIQGMGMGIQASVNPQLQSALRAYSSLPTEKLQEMSVQYGNSPQGQIVGRVLQARRSGQSQAPQANPAPAVPTGPMPQQQPTMRRGGGIARRAGGGPMGISMGLASPWWERAEERSDSGLLHGSTPGRADQLMATAPSGAYVIPADVVAGLGEGNTLAGAKVWDSILHSMPYGISAPKLGGGIGKARARTPPAPPGTSEMQFEAKGGGVQKGKPGERIPVALSHGEIVVSPEDVTRIGRGNISHGHKILDQFVMKARKHHIDTLKKLKPPVGAKAA